MPIQKIISTQTQRVLQLRKQATKRTSLKLKRSVVKMKMFLKTKKGKKIVKKIKKILARIPKVYRPSFAAVILGIIGKKPKRITGLEIRPMIAKLVKAKKRRIMKYKRRKRR
jgi:hypothetical protein